MELCVGRSLAVHSFGKTEIGWSSVSRIMIDEVFRAQFYVIEELVFGKTEIGWSSVSRIMIDEVFRAQFYVIGALFSLGKLQRVNNESLFDDTNFVT